MREFLVLILRAPNGSVVVLAVAASAVSPRSVELSLLVARARASAPPQPELPWFTEGEAVEPRPARAVSALEVVVDASTTDARTAAAVGPAEGWGREIWPRRSLKQERELRQQAALSAFVRQAQQARPSPRQARAAWQLQQVMLLAAALRRAGFPR
jgi:hypothetical protein